MSWFVSSEDCEPVEGFFILQRRVFPQLAPKYAWFAKMIDEKDIKAIEMMGRTCLVRLFFDI